MKGKKLTKEFFRANRPLARRAHLDKAAASASFNTALSLPRDTEDGFTTYLYLSGTTFFTLGYGPIDRS